MENSSLKIRLSVLWIFLAVAWLTWLVIVSEATFVSIIIVLVVFLIMAFLSMTLKDLANRRANIIMGIIFTGLTVLGLAGSLVTFGSVNEILLEVLKVVISALITWYAYKWPKGEAEVKATK